MAEQSPRRSAAMALLQPGMRLLERARGSATSGLLAWTGWVGVGAALLLFSLHGNDRRIDDDLAALKTERAGADSVAALIDLAGLLQQQRALLAHFPSNDDSASEHQRLALALTAAVNAVERNAQRSVTSHGQGSAQDWSPAWGRMRDGVKALTSVAHPGASVARASSDELIALYSQQIDLLNHLTRLVGERSLLLFDADAPSRFLVDLGVQRMIDWTETMATVNLIGSQLVRRADLGAPERAWVVARADALEHQLEQATFAVAALQRTGAPAPGGWSAASSDTAALVRQVREVFGADFAVPESSAFGALARQSEQSLNQLKKQTFAQLSQRLDQRAHALQRQAGIEVLIVALAAAALAYLALAQRALQRRASAGGAEAPAAGHAAPQAAFASDVDLRVDRINRRLDALLSQFRAAPASLPISTTTPADAVVARKSPQDEPASV